jgi:AcrR family transcriptional regulator
MVGQLLLEVRGAELSTISIVDRAPIFWLIAKCRASVGSIMAAQAEQRRTYLGGDARRAQILRVAAELFSERNYDAVSTADVARAAGVARGLVHHYFGTKRHLFLEVVRAMLAVPDGLEVAAGGDARERTEVLRTAIDRFLRTAERNRRTYLATAGGSGIGRDPDLEAVLKQASDRIIDRLIAMSWGPPADAPPELRALMEGYRGFAEAITSEWLERGRLPRRVVQELLAQALLTLVDEALPRIQVA